MNDAIIIQQVKSNSPYLHLLELTFARHARYCLWAKMDYRLEVAGDDMRGSWEKVHLVRAALDRYDHVIWIDADAVIWDLNCNLRSCCPRPVNVVQLPLPFPHLNVGVMFFKGCQASRDFCDDWIDGFPGPEPTREQHVFQCLAGGEKHNPHVGVLPGRCNSTEMLGTGCDDAIIKGWHGHSTYGGMHVLHEVMAREIKERKQANWIGV